MNFPIFEKIDWTSLNPQAMREFAPPAAEHIAQQKMLRAAIERHYSRNEHDYRQSAERMGAEIDAITKKITATGQPFDLGSAWLAYLRDAGERAVLFADILRQRGDIFLEHEAAGAPPVLIYDYDLVVDGADLPRPSNYILLRIKPKPGQEVFDWKRPYVIIDPRAGHGPGIGGFKKDSQVGVALADCHPVYFVAFRPHPVEGQTIADVTHTEAEFLREIRKRHPKSPKPIVVGNCQGGWATAILAATNPDLAGPIVLNGAPMAYWSGRLGQDPMRYTGGIAGGVLPAMLVSDLGGGKFDGANLVMNFEMLNPGRTWFRKYYDVFADADGDPARFLEFEKWWGGFFLMNDAEIRWIVEQLFVGNRLAKNEARLETGRGIDLKKIRAPVIVFASYGDNITPPQQALNWIVDTYVDEREIEVLGQRIVYMIHEEVGHLGIFVSSSVAKKEHSEMSSTLKTIEALAPGLYEMVISDMKGEGDEKLFTVDFKKRTMADIALVDDMRGEEAAFAAVARMSENLAEMYDATARPFVQASVPPHMAELGRKWHPMRAQRALFASDNPAMAAVARGAESIRQERVPVDPDNPFLHGERLMADMTEQFLDMWRDMRSVWFETTFLALYANPLALWFGRGHAKPRTLKRPDELRTLDIVQTALESIKLGGFAEAVVRMLVLLANTRGDVRRDRLERSAEVLTGREPFVSLEPAARARMIHMQSLIAEFEPDAGLGALPILLSTAADRAQAMAMVDYIVGAVEEMEPHTVERMTQIRQTLDLPPLNRPAKIRRKARTRADR